MCHLIASPNVSILLVSIFLIIFLLVNIVVAPPEQEEIVLAVCQVNIKQKMLAMAMARQRDSKS